MRMLCKQERIPAKPGYLATSPTIKKPNSSKQSVNNENQVANQQEDETFSICIGENRKSMDANTRKIKRSVINRSCINVVNYSCKALSCIPLELMRNSQMKLSGIQKLDLSFNNIWDIHQMCFDQMSSLKELLLNDNKISELPFVEINKCKGLRLINLNNNQLYIMPALTKISYLQAKSNPLNLITAELVKLTNLEFFTFDWLDYLIDYQPSQSQDKFKEYSLHYATFKRNILQKIDYQNQHNNNFCDFNCYFSVRFETQSKLDTQMNFLSKLIVKAMHKISLFFINYLKSFQNQINYAKLTYRSRLLLQIVFQANSVEALQLFSLKKSNYSELINDETYFQSLKLCCRYSNYTMFRYLFEMKKKRKRIQNLLQISTLIHQTIYRYNREKQGDKILFDLVSIYIDISGSPITVKIPHQFNSRIFKSLSSALLDVYQHEWLSHYFQVDFDQLKTTPIHFAMKSRNEELLKLLLQQNWDVFQQNQNGVSCKFTPGSTQISRKMVWKREKALIKKHFKQKQSNSIGEMVQKLPLEPRSSINQSIRNLVGYSSMQPSFIIYCAPKERIRVNYQNEYDSLTLGNRKQALKDQILPHLAVRAKQLHNLTWNQSYLRKMINIDVITFLLQKISCLKESTLPKRLENWIKVTESLYDIFEIVGKQNPLIQFEIIESLQWANIARENRPLNQIEVQTHRKSVETNNFWCCQTIPYQ